MTYNPMRGLALDYLPCRYGTSRLTFRGPKRKTEGKYTAVLGGTETYGKYIETPWPEFLEQTIGMPVANLAFINAGMDAYLNDPGILSVAAKARVKVVELTGAQNLSNRFYAVHPRRNDRFLRASNMLKSIYPTIDFTNYHFIRHLLNDLSSVDNEKFAYLVSELKEAWLARIGNLIDKLGEPVILLWIADHPVPEAGNLTMDRSGPLFVDRAMIDALAGRVGAIVEVVADASEVQAGRSDMVYGEMDAPAAAEMLGPVVHRRAARMLDEAVRGLL